MNASVLANPVVPYLLLGLVALAFVVVEIRHRRLAAGASADRAGARTPSSPPGVGWERGVLVVGALWLVLVLALYARLVFPAAGQLLASLPGDGLMRFLVAQLVAFCVIGLLAWIAFPRSSGIVTTVVLIVSSLLLVGLMRPWTAMARFIALAAWCACATNTIRHLVREWAGDEFADWGTSACVLGAFGIFASFGLGAARVMTHTVTALLALAVALPGLWQARAGIGRPLSSVLDRLRAIGPLGQASLEAIWLMMAIAFIVASGPETAFDSSHRYLPHIRGIAAHHGLYKQYVDVLWYRPEAVQTWMAAAFVLGATSLAKWLSWAALPALAILAAGELTRRSRWPDAAYFGAAAILSCPLLLWSATTLYVDHVIVWLCTGAFFVLVRALESDSWRGVVLSAVLMAAVAQSRQNVLIASALWLGLVAWHAWRSGAAKPLATRIAPSAVLLAVATAPWYLLTYAFTGNPVFPYLDGLFHSPLLPPGVSMMSVFSLFGAGKSWISHAVFPWTAVFHTSRLVEAPDGFLGCWFVALVPFMLGALRARGAGTRGVATLAVVGLLLTLITCIGTEYARYWLPGLALLLSAAALALAETWRCSRPPTSPWLARSLALPLLAALLVPLPLWTPRFVYGDLYLGKTTEDAALARTIQGYPVARDVNRLAGPDEGTVCTGVSYPGLLIGPAYELPYWKVGFVPGVKDPTSFDAFAAKNRIRYWIVERHGAGQEDQWFDDLLKVNTRYWVDDRMVSASGTTVAYWLGTLPGPLRLRPSERSELLESGWVASGGDRSATVPASGATIEQALAAPAGADFCRLRLSLSAGGAAARTLLASVVWRDTLGNPISDGEGPSELVSSSATFERAVYSKVPAAARTARCQLRSYQSDAVHVDRATVEWFSAVPRTPDRP